MDSDREVTVTITPGGQIRAITIGGHDIAHAVRADHAALTIAGRDRPLLSLALDVDRVTVQEPPDGQ